MKNKTKGVIAGIAGLALLTGGTTFALWSDQASVDGGTIVNGNLAVTADPIAWVDLSPDRTDSPHAIDLNTWRMVPGDIARGTLDLQVTLEGDNLVATLDVDRSATAALPEGVVVTYDVLDSAGTSVASGSMGTPTDLELDSSGTYTVLVDVAFDVDTSERDQVQAQTVLGDIVVSLDQVREGAGFNTP